MIEKQVRVNEQINASPVRLIDEDGNQLGIIPVEEALQKAHESGLDLVEVSPTARPPVCRVMDFDKFRYEMIKRDKIAKKKRHVIHVKEIKMRSEISEHDYNFKLKHAVEFLERGDKVKFTIFFRGREIIHKDKGVNLLKKIREELKERAIVESEPHLEGRNLSMIMTAKKTD